MSATVRIPTILRTYTGWCGRGECRRQHSGRSPGFLGRATIRASGRGSSMMPARCVVLSMSTSVTTMCVSLAAWMRKVAEGTKISIIPAVAGGAER